MLQVHYGNHKRHRATSNTQLCPLEVIWQRHKLFDELWQSLNQQYPELSKGLSCRLVELAVHLAVENTEKSPSCWVIVRFLLACCELLPVCSPSASMWSGWQAGNVQLLAHLPWWRWYPARTSSSKSLWVANMWRIERHCTCQPLQLVLLSGWS